jgi:hypothetical protein
MVKSRVYCLKQRLFPEGFVQKVHRAAFKRSLSRVVIDMRGDEDDRDIGVVRYQLTLKLESVHAGHPDIENQASRIARLIRTQERFRRRKTLRPKADGLDQIVERIPKRVVVVDNRNERTLGHAATISSRVSGEESTARGTEFLLDFGKGFYTLVKAAGGELYQKMKTMS